MLIVFDPLHRDDAKVMIPVGGKNVILERGKPREINDAIAKRLLKTNPELYHQAQAAPAAV